MNKDCVTALPVVDRLFAERVQSGALVRPNSRVGCELAAGSGTAEKPKGSRPCYGVQTLCAFGNRRVMFVERFKERFEELDDRTIQDHALQVSWSFNCRLQRVWCLCYELSIGSLHFCP